MAQANPFDQFDGQVAPVPVRQLQPIIGAQTPEEQARKAREDARAEEAAARAARGEQRDVAEFEGTGGKPTEAQGKVSTLLTRIKGGVNDIMSVRATNPDAQSPGFGETLAEGVFGSGVISRATAGPDRRIVTDAQRDVLDALLTLGTGAAYNAEQLEAETLAHFPQFGDTPQEIQIKNDRLQRLIESAKVQAGPKWDEIEQAIAPFMTTVGTPATGVDAGANSQLQAAFDSGASREELVALAQQLGVSIPNEAQFNAAIQYRDAGGKGASFFSRDAAQEEVAATEAVDPMVTQIADEIEARDGQAGLTKLATSGATLGLLDETAGVGGAIGELIKGNTDLAGNYQLWRNVERELQRRAQSRTGIAGTVAEVVGGGAGLRTIGTGAMSVGRAALEGAGVGGLAGFGYGEGANESLSGAAMGAAGGAALGAGFQRLANGRGGGGGAPPSGGSRVDADASNVVAIGAAENVPVMTSDVRRPRTWFGNWLQGTGEKLPIVGTGGMRAAQQESRVAMVEKLADDYAQTPATIDDVTADFMKTRGDEIAKFARQKREVFGSLAGAPPPAAQTSLDVLDKAIGRYGAQETFSGLTSKLQGWRNDLASARSIDDVESLRKSIGDTFEDESLKSASSAMRDIVNGPDGLYAAIKKDMGGYIRDNGGQPALAKWSTANARLSDFADDLEKNTVKRVLRTGEATPEEAATLLFSKKPSDVKALFANLSQEGQKRARAVVVQKLVDDAGGVNELSTAKFRTALQRSADTFGVIFPKAEADRLTGMLRLLQATRRAEQASVTTPTGQSTLPFVGAGGIGFLAGDWFGAAGVGGATAAAFRIYESKAMRNLLVSLNKTQPGSRAEQNVLATIQKVTAANAPKAADAAGLQRQAAASFGPDRLAAEDEGLNTRGSEPR